MIKYLDEIDSDLSVFHRVDDPDALSAPRFLKYVRHLHHYEGAFQHALMAAHQAQQPQPMPGAAAAGLPVDTPPEVMARLSESNRFPGIEYD